MRVLLVATVQSHIGQFHKPLMKLLKENNWEIHVAAKNNLKEKNGLCLEYPDIVFDIPFQRSPFDRRNISAYWMLKQVLEENHYDVIHCNTPVGGVLGRILGRKYRKDGTKIFYTSHGFHFYEGAPKLNWIIYYPIEKWLSRYTDKLITITEEDYNRVRKRFHCPVFRIHSVGANSKKYYPISEEEKESRKRMMGIKGPLIMNVGELLHNKNQRTAILMMKIIVRRFPDARLFIAGNGPEKENLHDLIVKHGLESNISLLGYTTELEKYLQICDLEVACSYREGLPLNILEAMLCGKPIVASVNRGHKELVNDGVNGYLIEPRDVREFARAVLRVLKSPNDYAEASLEKAGPYMDTAVQEELKLLYGL